MHDEFSFVVLCSVASSQNPQFCLVPEEGGEMSKNCQIPLIFIQFFEKVAPQQWECHCLVVHGILGSSRLWVHEVLGRTNCDTVCPRGGVGTLTAPPCRSGVLLCCAFHVLPRGFFPLLLASAPPLLLSPSLSPVCVGPGSPGVGVWGWAVGRAGSLFKPLPSLVLNL